MHVIMRSFALSLHRNCSGVAMIEFALSLPIILLMGLGGTELAHMAIARERVDQIAMLVADNAARVRDTIDENDVNDIMTGAKLVGQSIDFGNHGRIILSDVQNNPANNGQWIRWQRCAGAKNVSSSYGAVNDGWQDTSLQAGVGPTGNKVTAATGTIVMFVEVVYDYQPIVPVSYFGARTFTATQAFNVRDRMPASSTLANGSVDPTPPSDIKNQSNLATAQKSDCSLYSA
jgi:hypothetical protein